MKSAEIKSVHEQFTCFHLHETPSTMAEARNLSQTALLGVVYTDIQTAGRGRLPGRSWNCNPGEGLLATFWFPFDYFSTCPPALVAGTAVLQALMQILPQEKLAVQPLEIKWPNDILSGHKKLAGILCERSGDILYTGIGINLAQKDFPDTYRTPPTSVLLSYNCILDRETLLAVLMERFAHLKEKPEEWHALAEQYCAYKEKEIVFQRGTDTGMQIHGILKGIDPNGFLILQNGDEISHEASGEIVLHSCQQSGKTIDPDPIIE